MDSKLIRQSPSNLGDCRNISWADMKRRFIEAYTNPYTEYELIQIHNKWKRIYAEVGGR